VYNTYRLYEYHDGCLIRGRNYLSFASTWVHYGFLVESVLLIFLASVLCFSVLFVFPFVFL